MPLSKAALYVCIIFYEDLMGILYGRIVWFTQLFIYRQVQEAFNYEIDNDRRCHCGIIFFSTGVNNIYTLTSEGWFDVGHGIKVYLNN